MDLFIDFIQFGGFGGGVCASFGCVAAEAGGGGRGCGGGRGVAGKATNEC